ncbi:MAG: hypothetical protein R3B93_10835 [Bacteroidia bacterium]
MKILLDECVTKKLKAHLSEFSVYTVGEMGFSGLKNGKLLAEAQKHGFDILLTIDKNIDSQQNIGKYALSLVVFDVEKSNIKYFVDLIPQFKSQIKSYQKGKVYVIE